FRLAAGGSVFALKLFPPPEADGRDRLATEVEALRLMQQHGIAGVARVVAVDPAQHSALLSWLDGAPIATPTDADIDAAVGFLAPRHALRASAGAFRRSAAEACLSGHEVERQIRGRLAALLALQATEPVLASFLRDTFSPALAALLVRAERAFESAGLDFATP